MTSNSFFRRPHRLVFILFILFALTISGTAFGKKRNASGRGARAQKSKKSSASARNRSSRRGRATARASRRGRGGRLTARDVRRQRALIAREQSSALRSLERRL